VLVPWRQRLSTDFICEQGKEELPRRNRIIPKDHTVIFNSAENGARDV
jgi:hypothetical protein